LITEDEFISGCLEGLVDGMKELPEWLEMTKKDKKEFAEKSVKTFEKIYYGFSMLNDASGINPLASLDK